MNKDKNATFKVMTYNIWHDMNNWPARRDFMISEISNINPDVISLQEVLEHKTLLNQAADLARELGYEYRFFSTDPFRGEKRYGNAILSKYPILTSSMHLLEPFDYSRLIARVLIKIDNTKVDIYTTHLHHIAEDNKIRETQLYDILNFINHTKKSEQVLLMGDFNMEPDWQEAEILKPRFIDVFSLFNKEKFTKKYSTRNYNIDNHAQRIDYMFLERSENAILKPLKSQITLNNQGPENVWASDHFALLNTFEIINTK